MNAAMHPDPAWEAGAPPEGDEASAPPDDALAAGDDAADPADADPEIRADAATPPGASDPQLAAWIALIVERDERALALLYDATVTRVFGLARRIVRDAALAEEVVEDAYFQVWRQAVRFDPARGKALTWLLAMARSRAIDALRREARFERSPLDEQNDLPVTSAEPACDELLDLARHHADLHQALMQLGAQPRQLVSMSFFRGLSHEDIAEQMGLPLGTVKSQIRRALQVLREVLGDRGSRLLAS